MNLYFHPGHSSPAPTISRQRVCSLPRTIYQCVRRFFSRQAAAPVPMALPPQAAPPPIALLPQAPLRKPGLEGIQWDLIQKGDPAEIEIAMQRIDQSPLSYQFSDALTKLFHLLEPLPVPIHLSLTLFGLKTKSYTPGLPSMHDWFDKGKISIPDSPALRGKFLFLALQSREFKLCDLIVNQARAEGRLMELADFRDGAGESLLHRVMVFGAGDNSRIDWAVGIGTDINSVNHAGVSVLESQISLCNWNIVYKLLEHKPKLTPELKMQAIKLHPELKWRIALCEEQPGYAELYQALNRILKTSPTYNIFDFFFLQHEKQIPLWVDFIQAERPSEEILPYAAIYFFTLQGEKPEKGWAHALELFKQMSALPKNWPLSSLIQYVKTVLFISRDSSGSQEHQQFLSKAVSFSRNGIDMSHFLTFASIEDELPPFNSLDELTESLSESFQFDFKTFFQLENEEFAGDVASLRSAIEKLAAAPKISRIRPRLETLIDRFCQFALNQPLSTEEIIAVYKLNDQLGSPKKSLNKEILRAHLSEGRFPDINPIELINFFMQRKQPALCHAIWKRTDPKILQQANQFWIHDFLKYDLFELGKEWLTDILKIVPIDQPDLKGMTPLGYLLLQEETNTQIEYFLSNGANPNCPSEKSLPIDLAVRESGKQAAFRVALLIDRGANVTHFTKEAVENSRTRFPKSFLKIFEQTHPNERSRLNVLDQAKKSLKKPFASLAHRLYDEFYQHPDLIDRLSQFNELDSIQHPFLKLLFIHFPAGSFSPEEIEKWTHLIKDEQIALMTIKSLEILLSFCHARSNEVLRWLKKGDPFSAEVQSQLKDWEERASLFNFFKPNVLSDSVEQLAENTDQALRPLIGRPNAYEIFQELKKRWPSLRGWAEFKYYLLKLLRIKPDYLESMGLFIQAVSNGEFPKARYLNSPQLDAVFKARTDLEPLWRKTGLVKEIKPPVPDLEKAKELEFPFTQWLVDQINDPNHLPPQALFELASLIPSFLTQVRNHLGAKAENIDEGKLFSLCQSAEQFEELIPHARKELIQFFQNSAAQAAFMEKIHEKIKNLIPGKIDVNKQEKITRQSWLRLMGDLIQFCRLETKKFQLEAWNGIVHAIFAKCQNKALALSETLFAEQLANLPIQWRNALAKKTVLIGKISDDPVDLLLMGTEVEGSCQKILKIRDDKDTYNGNLSRMLMNGNSQLALLVDEETGKIEARAILKLAFDPKGNIYLYQERTYPAVLSLENQQFLDDVVRHRAKELNLPLAGSCGHLLNQKKPFQQDLTVHRCNVPHEYIDTIHRSEKNGSLIMLSAPCEPLSNLDL